VLLLQDDRTFDTDGVAVTETSKHLDDTHSVSVKITSLALFELFRPLGLAGFEGPALVFSSLANPLCLQSVLNDLYSSLSEVLEAGIIARGINLLQQSTQNNRMSISYL